MVEHNPEYDPGHQLEETITEASAAAQVTVLRSAARELLTQVSMFFSDDEKRRLDRVLTERVGQGLEDERKKVDAAIERVLVRGRIANDHEWYLLGNRADELEPGSAEFERIAALLGAYKRSPPAS